MAGESLGTARLDLTVDITDFAANLNRAKSLADGLGADAARAFEASTGASKKAAASLLRYAQTIGMSADQIKLFRANLQGVDGKVLLSTAENIKSVRTQLELASKAARDLAAAEAMAAQQKVVGENFLSGLQQSAAAIGKNKTELLEMRAAELGVANAAAPFIASMRNAAEAASELAAAEQRAAASTNFLHSLQQTALAATKTRAEMLELKAAELGVAQAAAPFIAQLKAQESQLHNTGTKFNEYGLSVKQTQAALRQVPAQLTDIFVGLQGGQNPLTVLIQQGGQLKDVFGGIKPAAQALGGALLRLINPYTLLAAAIAGVVAVEVSAENQTSKLAQALIFTGNNADLTTDQMQRMIEQFDSLDNITGRGAAAALTEVVGSGKIAAESIESVTRAALAMQDATGKAVADTVAEFAALRIDPVNAILKLEESYHFLTRAQLDEIETLQEQGDVAGAAALATEAWADTQVTRSAEAVESLGLVTGAWHDIKKGTGEAYDGMVQFFVDLDKQAKDGVNALDKLQRGWANLFHGGMFGGGMGFAAMDDISGRNDGTAATATAQARKIDAEAERQFVALHLSNLSKERRQELEILKIKKLGLAAGREQADIDAEVAASQARYNESIHKKVDHSGERLENADAKLRLQAIKDALEVEQGAIQSSTQMLQAQYAARLVTAEDYYAQSRDLIERNAHAEENAIIQQIAVLKGRDVAGAKGVDVLRQIASLESDLAKVRAESGTKLAILGVQEQDYYTDRLNSILQFKERLEETNDAMRDANAEVVAKITMGDEEFQLQQKINDIYREQAKVLRDLAQALREGRIDQTQYDAEVEARREATDTQVQIVRDGYDAMKEAQQDWLSGLQSGIKDWISSTQDVAGQIRDITTKSLDSATDAIVDFATTGKAEIKELLASILKDIAAFMIKQAVLGFLKAFMPSLFGGSADAGGGNNFGIPLLGDIVKGITGGGQVSGASMFGPMPSTPSGTVKAGSQAIGSSGSSVHVTVPISITGGEGGKSDATEAEKNAAMAQFQQDMRNAAQQEIQNAMRPNGTLWRAGVSVR